MTTPKPSYDPDLDRLSRCTVFEELRGPVPRQRLRVTSVSFCGQELKPVTTIYYEPVFSAASRALRPPRRSELNTPNPYVVSAEFWTPGQMEQYYLAIANPDRDPFEGYAFTAPPSLTPAVEKLLAELASMQIRADIQIRDEKFYEEIGRQLGRSVSEKINADLYALYRGIMR